MFIKQFRSSWVRVPDPLRPGKRTDEERLLPTGASSISHDGKTYEAGEDGWFEVPAHVGAHLLSFLHPGSERFCTPAEVDETPAAAVAAPAAAPAVAQARPRTRKTDS